MRRALPKPGAWMDTLKQVFAFPMYAIGGLVAVGSRSAILFDRTGSDARRRDSRRLRGLGISEVEGYLGPRPAGPAGDSAAAVLLALVLPARFADVAAAAPTAATSAASESSEGWQPYDLQRVRELRASGAPLLVNFTASWCLTCLVNERNAFADPQVQGIFPARALPW